MVTAWRWSAMTSVWPMPVPLSMYHGWPLGLMPSFCHRLSSSCWVPELSPRETNGTCAWATLFSASSAEASPLMWAGSDAGPTIRKSLCMTSRRSVPLPCCIHWTSLCGAWTRTTSASPRAPSARAAPVPTLTVLTR